MIIAIIGKTKNMTEKSSAPTGGLPQNFDLGTILSQDDQVDLYAVRAAQSLFDAHEQALTDSTIDEKTGLLVQKTWMKNLDTVLETTERQEGMVHAYVADLNGFKAVNDALGHAAGDELLGLVGRAFSDTFRRDTDEVARGSRESATNGSIARLGGDEFAVFTVARDAHSVNQRSNHESTEEALLQSKRVNERLLELLADSKFSGYAVSLAVGSAKAQPNDTAESLFARADYDMFEKKYSAKINRLTPEDKQRLAEMIPYLESIGTRVEGWLKTAVLDEKSEGEIKINRVS